MSKWPTVELGDVVCINPKPDRTLRNNELVSFLRMADVSDDGTTGLGSDRPYCEVSKGYTPFLNGDIIIAKITPCFQNGKIAQVTVGQLNAFGSTEFHVVRTSANIDSRYLLHFLRRSEVRLDGERRMTGTGGQRRVPADFIATLPIPLPDVSEQRRIAAILDQANGLHAKRHQAVEALSALREATFLEMFGNPARNAMGWPLVQLRAMVESCNYGTTEKASISGTYPVLRMNNITYQGDIDMTDLKYMELSPDKLDRYTVRDGDILFNRTNSVDLVGKTAVYHGHSSVAFAGYLIRLRTTQGNEPEYISAFLNSRYGKAILRSMCKSIIGMANINAQEIQSIKIPRPPAELQKKFADSLRMLAAAQSRYRSSLAQLDALSASLQARAFAGEL